MVANSDPAVIDASERWLDLLEGPPTGRAEPSIDKLLAAASDPTGQQIAAGNPTKVRMPLVKNHPLC